MKIDNWDDFTFKISYKMIFRKNANSDPIDIGHVRILNSVEKNKRTPKYFKSLSDEYCSLGGSLDYYEILKTLGYKIQSTVLINLNDLAYNPKSISKFENLEGYNNAILREGNSILLNAKKYFIKDKRLSTELEFNGESHVVIKNFLYRIKLERADDYHEVSFNLESMRMLDNRIHVIIGKNGTGKTQFLRLINRDLNSDETLGHFDTKPDFNLVMAVTYSALEKFNNDSDKSFNNNRSYIFDGSYNVTEDIRINLNNAYQRIVEYKRDSFWIESIMNLLDLDNSRFENASVLFKKIGDLSSGQRIIVEIITKIVAHIRFNSIILFDEPEIHLHPNALSKLIRVLNVILNDYDSYCIVATHSPFIVRQIPSNCISIFDRVGNVQIV